MPSLQRGTHLLDKPAEPGLESDLLFFLLIFIISLQFETDASWNEPAQHKEISKNNVADPLPPALLSWIPFFFCYFWLPFFHLSPQTYQYSMATSSTFPNSTYYSPVILPRSLFKSWFLYALLINIAFTIMPVFAITAIVFRGQKGMEVKLQNSDILGIRNGPEFWVLVLGFFFMNTIIVLGTVWISSRVSSFH